MRNRWFPPQGRNRKSTHKHPNSTSRQASTFRRYAGFHLLPETNQELVGQSHKPDFVYGTGYPIQSVFDSCGLTDCRIENAARPRRSHNRRCLDWMLASLADTIPCSCSLFHRSDTGWGQPSQETYLLSIAKVAQEKNSITFNHAQLAPNGIGRITKAHLFKNYMQLHYGEVHAYNFKNIHCFSFNLTFSKRLWKRWSDP